MPHSACGAIAATAPPGLVPTPHSSPRATAPPWPPAPRAAPWNPLRGRLPRARPPAIPAPPTAPRPAATDALLHDCDRPPSVNPGGRGYHWGDPAANAAFSAEAPEDESS